MPESQGWKLNLPELSEGGLPPDDLQALKLILEYSSPTELDQLTEPADKMTKKKKHSTPKSRFKPKTDD